MSFVWRGDWCESGSAEPDGCRHISECPSYPQSHLVTYLIQSRMLDSIQNGCSRIATRQMRSSSILQQTKSACVKFRSVEVSWQWWQLLTQHLMKLVLNNARIWLPKLLAWHSAVEWVKPQTSFWTAGKSVSETKDTSGLSHEHKYTAVCQTKDMSGLSHEHKYTAMCQTKDMRILVYLCTCAMCQTKDMNVLVYQTKDMSGLSHEHKYTAMCQTKGMSGLSHEHQHSNVPDKRYEWTISRTPTQQCARQKLYLYLGFLLARKFTYLLTHSMEQSPSWEANWFCS